MTQSSRPTLVVFASGTSTGGGSGFENLVNATKGAHPVLDADIVAVVTNHQDGGVYDRAKKLGVPCIYFPGPYTAEGYASVLQEVQGDWVALSGWLKKTVGLNPRTTFNIHPGLLSVCGGKFGGKGMYGERVHKAVHDAYHNGEICETGFSMHFVTDEFDKGPVFFEHRIPITNTMSAEDIAAVVHAGEHEWQPIITNLVVHSRITWDGEDPKSLRNEEANLIPVALS